MLIKFKLSKFFMLLVFGLLFASNVNAQVKDYSLGRTTEYNNMTGAFYDFSDPTMINISVSVWGAVRFPGKYKIPANSTVLDLIDYSGGPMTDSDIEDVRLFRREENKDDQLFVFSLDDMMWGDSLDSKSKNLPELKAGDVIMIQGQDRYFFRDWFTMTTSLISALLSLAVFIYNISK